MTGSRSQSLREYYSAQPDDMLSVRVTAAAVGMNISQLDRNAADGGSKHIPYEQTARGRMYRRRTVDEWIEHHGG